jgi:hypothetical protein
MYRSTKQFCLVLSSMAIIIANCFCGSSSAQNQSPPKTTQGPIVQTTIGAPPEKPDILNPLSDEERHLDPRQLLLNQPDFAADVSFFAADYVAGKAIGGMKFDEHIVVKGQRFREESPFWIFVGEIGKSAVRLYPAGKLFDDMVGTRGQAPASGVTYPKLLAADQEVSFTALGTVQIADHKCIKIEAVRKDSPGKINYYVDKDLRNFVVASQLVGAARHVMQNFHNISFDVDDKLVEVPSDFSPIQRDRWTKVDTAKVTYKGKASSSFGVFRSPNGELFIWIQDAYYPWEYLYRPEKSTVEVAFQGLLVNRAGEFIWKTTETEAFSLPTYRIADSRTHAEKVTVKGNSISFHSFSYARDNATIEVSW